MQMTVRLPAGPGQWYDDHAAAGLPGNYVQVTVGGLVRTAVVVAADVVEGGAAAELTIDIAEHSAG